MIKHIMSDIKRGKVVIPGGWTARIPAIRLYDNERDVYVRYYMSKGMSEARALDAVLASFNALWVRAWTMTLREALVNAAKRYMKMHPDLGMAGFDPEVVQAAYVPGENTGNVGKPALKELLRQLGEKERGRQR